jgi:hypothetical protein
MHAAVGDHLVIHGRKVGDPDRDGEIRQVLGEDGSPPYLVRFGDGAERMCWPAAGAVIEPPGASQGS